MIASGTTAAAVSVDVVTVPPDAAGVEDGGMLPPAGSLVIYTGDASSPTWRGLREAILRADWQAVRDTPGPKRPAKMVAASHFFDVRCAGHTLVRDLVLPAGTPFRTLTLPYTGGPVGDADFDVVEHIDRGASEVRTEHLLLLRAPELSRVERELLESVGPELRHIHLGPPRPCGSYTTMEQVTAVVERMTRDAVRDKQRAGVVPGERDMALPAAAAGEVTGRQGDLAASVARLLATRRRLLFG
ncbi:hypothetical protein [Streptomyces klenkii]